VQSHPVVLTGQECAYQIVPPENLDRGMPAALIFCDSRAAGLYRD
jgi:hypothetical protein